MIYRTDKLLLFSPRRHAVPIHSTISAFIRGGMATGAIQGVALVIRWASFGIQWISSQCSALANLTFHKKEIARIVNILPTTVVRLYRWA